MEQPTLQQDSPAWVLFVCASFGTALTLMVVGICALPVDLWIKGYLGMGLFFLTGSTVMLSKTMRDQHESRRTVRRLEEAKTEKILNEYNLTR